MESLTGDFKADYTENNAVSSCSLEEEEEEEEDFLKRRVEEAEETINTLTKEHRLKVETLETEIAKLREELSKKV